MARLLTFLLACFQAIERSAARAVSPAVEPFKKKKNKIEAEASRGAVDKKRALNNCKLAVLSEQLATAN